MTYISTQTTATRRKTDLMLPLFGRFYIDLSPRSQAIFSLVQVISTNRVSSIMCRGPPAQNHLWSSAQQQGDGRWSRWNTWKCAKDVPREVMKEMWKHISAQEMTLQHCDSGFGPILIIPKRNISYHIPLSKEEGVNGVSRVSHCAALHPAKSRSWDDSMRWKREKVKRVHSSNPTTICSSGDFIQSDLTKSAPGCTAKETEANRWEEQLWH